MIYPTDRLIWLTAAGAPVALLLGVLVPALWLLPVGWCALLLVLAAYDALVAPRGLVATAILPGAVNVGESFAAGVRVDGRAAHVEAAFAGDPLLRADANGRTRVDGTARLPITAIRRGLARIAHLDLRWQGPLGLAWRQRAQPLDHVITVTPDIRPVRSEGVTLLSREARTGQMTQLDTGQGSEFDALADWQSGHDRRRIDWKQSARHARLLAKEYRAERDNNIVLAFDCGRTMCEPIAGLPRLDRAISAGLLTTYVCLKMGDRVSLFGFDARPRVASAPLSGIGAFAALQHSAAALDYSNHETNYTLALSTLAARLDRRSLVLLFTDFVDTASAELMLRSVGRLLERHVLLCVVLRDDELEGLAGAAPETSGGVSRAVIAAGLLRERAIVLTRLRRLGVEVLETRWQDAGPEVARRYLEAKRRRL